jgi:hypothetical protein
MTRTGIAVAPGATAEVDLALDTSVVAAPGS